MSDATDAGETRRSWWRELWIYAVMIAVALIGIAYTVTGGPDETGVGPPLIWVWGAIIPIYFLACVWHGWDSEMTRQQKLRFLCTQALHWLAFLAAMQIVRLRQVQGLMDDTANGVTLLTLLAFGTFLAGVHAWSLPICLTGIVLCLAVPLMAFIEQTALLLVVLLAGAAIAGGVLWWLYRRPRGGMVAG
jgi:hypothetical protein